MRKAVFSEIDNYGLLQGVSAAPRFNSLGTSPKGQVWVLMMEDAYRKLEK